MEALKPLLVLGLFGTILYGAYSVVQKGAAPTVAATTPAPDAPEAPAFAPPEVRLPAEPVTPAPAAAPVSAPVAAAATSAVPDAPTAAPTAPPNPPSAVQPPPAELAVAAIAAPATSAPATGPAAAGVPPTAPPATTGSSPAASADPAPTYLTAESAPPPVQEPVAATPPFDPGSRPERLASLSGLNPPAADGLEAAAAPIAPAAPLAAAPSSAAFASAWADAHDKLAGARYAEALTALSVWYDDPSLGLEESQRLEDLLGQLAGTVIYSQEDLLLPPHVVAPGETLPAIAAPLGVSWQLLAKINGVPDPSQLVPGERLKVVRGPFDAVVSLSRRRLSLQLHGNYAGSFAVIVGRQYLDRVGSSIPVVSIQRAAAADPASPARSFVALGEGLAIESADDPAAVADAAPTSSLVMSPHDLAELVDILGPGSRVLIRQ